MTRSEALQLLRLEPVFDLLTDVATKLTGYKYTFYHPDELMASASGTEFSRRYWIELLGRAHLAASTALLRQDRWMRGMVDACTVENFIIFASSFRGFVESSADIWDGLNGIATMLAAEFRRISDAVNGTALELLAPGPLEDRLIHFSFAQSERRRLVPDPSGIAKKMSEYLAQLEGASSGPIHDCYAELCEIAHPAAESTLCFVRGSASEYELTNASDEAAIRDLCNRHAALLPQLVQKSLNPPLLVLKTLNEFPIEPLLTPVLDEISLDQIEVWHTIKAHIDTARKGHSIH